jgi:peptide/nickel transport system ATP-binding protein
LLEVTDLVVHFDTDRGIVEAVDEASLNIEEGEVVALVGESGCGKTTTARAILRVIPSPPGIIKGGRIIFGNQDILAMDEDELNTNVRGKTITLIPQDPFASFNPLFTIGTQIWDTVGPKYLNGIKGNGNARREGKKMLREKILGMLSRVQLAGLDSLLRKYPYELSGGQRQRIMIAMALLTNPLLVIADEPTTALDVTVQAQIIALLRGLVEQQGVSVLYITHDLAVASKIADRVVVMYAGQEVESAPTGPFFEAPAHPYTQKLLTCLPNPKGKIRDIPGRVPTLVSPPKGCRFHPRCDRAVGKCDQERPPWVEIGPGHWLRCYNPFLDQGRENYPAIGIM